TGLNRGRHLDIPGLHLDGILQGVDFLINVNLGYRLELGNRVVVVGGGNIAVDVARSAVRILQEPQVEGALLGGAHAPAHEEGAHPQGYLPALDMARLALRAGALHVRLVSTESRETMSAWENDVREAEAEGVALEARWRPAEILGRDGRVSGIRFLRNLTAGQGTPGEEEFTVECDSVILAVGQEADLGFLSEGDDIRVGLEGWIQVGPSLATTASGVFAAGDVAFGPRALVEVVAQGHDAARAIHQNFCGRPDLPKRPARFRPIAAQDLPPDTLALPRQPMPSLALNRRIGISEVALGYDEGQARREASRCFKCQINTIFDESACILCGACADVCPEFCLRLVPAGPLQIGLPPALSSRGETTMLIKDETRCTRCGLCAQRCPSGAITMEALEPESFAAPPSGGTP
ncbi:MAG: hypothetical protein B7X11_03315, partial [Acidobacteria bacterium 37-65-4]